MDKSTDEVTVAEKGAVLSGAGSVTGGGTDSDNCMKKSSYLQDRVGALNSNFMDELMSLKRSKSKGARTQNNDSSFLS